MEFISHGALKSSSFFSEATAEMRPSSCSLDGELWYAAAAAAINGGFPAGDDFSVDEYFDLSAGEGFEGEVGGNDDDEEEKRSSSSTTSSSSSLSSSQDQIDEGSSFLAGLSGSDPLVSGELAIPVDDMKELEIWSHLMDETVSDEYMTYPSGPSAFTPSPNPWKRAAIEPEGKEVQSKPVDFPANVPAKPRTKLSKRPGPASWLRSPHLKPESSRFSLADGVGPRSDFILIPNPGHVNMGELVVREPAKKKQKRKPATPGLEMGGNSSGQIRRCTHCQVQKTPQWRTGPLGPKTLCNACGVRYKSGRLFPEYRPACSPTFSSEVHSNSHRKVLEMRKKKDAGEPESEIPSCCAPEATVLSC